MAYRTNRNIEASLIDFISSEMTSVWNDVNVVKTFQQVTAQALPAVCIRVGDNSFERAEIGGSNLIRDTQVFIDIFATSDGLKEDLVDWVVEILKEGCVFYTFTTTKAARTTTVTNKTVNGRIRITDIKTTNIDFSVDNRLCSRTVPFLSEKCFLQVLQQRHRISCLRPLQPCHRRLPFPLIPASGHDAF
jgi:hypothetical protein